MKILILTQPLVENYGGVIQNFALQTVLRKMGHDVETLDIVPMEQFNRKKAWICLMNKAKSLLKHSILFCLSPHKKPVVRVWFSEKEKSILYAEITRFIDKHIKRTGKIRSHKDLTKLPEYDAYIVGSDQVWRPSYSPDISVFFLDFLPDHVQARKIAYATSLGNSIWEFTEREALTCKRLLSNFHAVSVREKSAIELCQKYFDMPAQLVPDPTMLLTRKEYLKLIENEPLTGKNKVVSYILDNSPVKQGMTNELSKFHQMQILSLTLPQRISPDVRQFRKASVEQWLAAIASAEYVVTDSFHGAIFSIIFNKQFFIISNTERGADRFQTLVELFSLQDRVIAPDSRDWLMLPSIDYQSVNDKHQQLRKQSINFLLQALEK